MLLITVTNWKHKAGVVIRLLLFLLLIWLITPQFFSFVAGRFDSFKNRFHQSQPVEMRVEQQPRQAPEHGDRFLEWLQGYYTGDDRQVPSGSE